MRYAWCRVASCPCAHVPRWCTDPPVRVPHRALSFHVFFTEKAVVQTYHKAIDSQITAIEMLKPAPVV